MAGVRSGAVVTPGDAARPAPGRTAPVPQPWWEAATKAARQTNPRLQEAVSTALRSRSPRLVEAVELLGVGKGLVAVTADSLFLAIGQQEVVISEMHVDRITSVMPTAFGAIRVAFGESGWDLKAHGDELIRS